MWPIPFAVELAKFDRYFHVRSTIKFPLTTIVHRNHSIESNSSIESQSEERRRKKKRRRRRRRKKTKQMIESCFSIDESRPRWMSRFPIISSDHGLRLINFHGWGNLWIDGARLQRKIMTQGSRDCSADVPEASWGEMLQ